MWQTGVSNASSRNGHWCSLSLAMAALKSSTSRPTDPPPGEGCQSGAPFPMPRVFDPMSYSTNPLSPSPKNRDSLSPSTPS